MRARLYLLAFFLGSVLAAPSWGGSFTEVMGALPSQPLDSEARLVYWDQSAAEAVGLQNPAGSPGEAALDEWARSHLGFEIAEGAKALPAHTAPDKTTQGTPFLFVEKDGEGGAGRAAYLKVGNSWVNLKGLGITGFGRTKAKVAGPPSAKFESHGDGSTSLDEAIKEAVYGRVSDNELSRGGGRVIGIMTTGRKLRYSNGVEVPLAVIIRAPMKRGDQEMDPAMVIDSLAEANSKRLFKGDYVNSSNMGSHGQMIDYGCMSHTCGMLPATSSQNAMFLYEHNQMLKGRNWDELAQKSLGNHLLNQLGVPESQLTNVAPAKLKSLGDSLMRLTFANYGRVLIDREQVPEERLQHASGLDGILPEVAPDFFEHPGGTKADFKARMKKLLSEVKLPGGKSPNPAFASMVDEWLGYAFDALSDVDAGSTPEAREAFAKGIRKVAAFKNRTIGGLLRPVVVKKSEEIAEQFAKDGDASAVQKAIDSIVHGNRLGTGSFADGDFALEGDAKETRLYVRAAKDSAGKPVLFSHPQWAGPGEGETMNFRVSTDLGKTHHDYPAHLVQTDQGPQYLLRIPNGPDFKPGHEPTSLMPFVQKADGQKIWVGEGASLEGPSLFLNEHLGLAADQLPREDLMGKKFGVNVRAQVPRIGGAKPAEGHCKVMFEMLNGRPASTLSQ